MAATRACPAGFFGERGKPQVRVPRAKALLFTNADEVVHVVEKLRAAGWACCPEPYINEEQLKRKRGES